MTQLALLDVPRVPTEWDEREAYYSDPRYVWPLLQYLQKLKRCMECVIVEPCVGGGALVDGLAMYWYGTDRDVITGDIRDVGADWQGDWTGGQKHWRWNRSVGDKLLSAGLVLSNPAFSIAREIVEASWSHSPQAVVAMLLPARWYAFTKDRGEWLRAHNPDRINIGRCEFFRPDGSSAGDGDSTDYEWMIWGPDRQGPRGGHHELMPWREAPNG